MGSHAITNEAGCEAYGPDLEREVATVLPTDEPAAVNGLEPTPAAVRRRVGEVVTALMMAGLDTPLARMRVTHCATWRCRAHCTWRRWTGKASTGRSWPVALRDTMIRLGPAFVKIGQILSVRTDLVPAAMAETLHSLQSDVPPVPYEWLRPVLEEELGEPVGGWLARLDERPLAAGSVAQVHVGWLADGRKVAVKVKRPGIDPIMRLDLAVLRWLAAQAERHWPASRPYRPVAAAEELERYTLRELDFRQEADVARRLGARHAAMPESRIRIPTIHRSTDSLIVMEFIEGFPADRRDAYAEHGLDPHEVLQVGIDAVITQIFDFGLFHADPHPGNLHISPDGQLVMLDFGIFGEVDARLARSCALVMWALTRGDTALASLHLVRLADIQPGADVPGFRRAVEARYRAWRKARVRDYGLGRLVFDELTLGARYGLEFPSDAILVGKALVTVEGVILWVDPDTDLAVELEPHLGRVARKLFDPKVLTDELVRSLPTWWDVIEHLPLGPATALDAALVAPLQAAPSPPQPTSAPLGARQWVVVAAAVLVAAGVAQWSPAVAASAGAAIGAIAVISSRRP